jgi:hypothetical protein
MIAAFCEVWTKAPVFSSQRENPADSDIVALVELDIKKMRLRIFLARNAIRERLRELDNPSGGTEANPGKRRSLKFDPERTRSETRVVPPTPA